MAKRLMVLVGMLAVLLVVAVPALAQEGNETTIPVGVTGDTKTVNFELTVEGTPPADAMFFGCGEFPVRQLTDPDGDGIYTGSVTFPVSDFTSELRPFSITQAPAVVPACMVLVRTEDGFVGRVVEDFGLVGARRGQDALGQRFLPRQRFWQQRWFHRRRFR